MPFKCQCSLHVGGYWKEATDDQLRIQHQDNEHGYQEKVQPKVAN